MAKLTVGVLNKKICCTCWTPKLVVTDQKRFRSVLSRIRQFTVHLKSWQVLITTLPLTSSSSLAKEKDQCICVISPDPSWAALHLVLIICLPCWPADAASLAFGLEKA